MGHGTSYGTSLYWYRVSSLLDCTTSHAIEPPFLSLPSANSPLLRVCSRLSVSGIFQASPRLPAVSVSTVPHAQKCHRLSLASALSLQTSKQGQQSRRTVLHSGVHRISFHWCKIVTTASLLTTVPLLALSITLSEV